tara:strand:- start:1065 stop:1622 length:558 start_codon:yes stop_codon:yes gene_type:complete
MVLTPSKKIKLGFKAPYFELLNPVQSKKQSLSELQSNKATLIIFMCNHCPYVVHILEGIVQLANDYIPLGVSIIGINSNDSVNFPADSPDKMIDLVKDYNIPFPYLFDESQDVAKSYHATCTPDFSVFNKNMECVYRGQMDASRPGSDNPIDAIDLRNVLDTLLSNNTVDPLQKPSIGCNIKWRG